MAYPMGEANQEPLRVDFDRRLKLDFHGSDITSDAGLLPYRELDHALELTELGGEVLSETRRGKNTRHLLVGLLRQSVFGRLAGYEDVNDAERLSHDPVMRAIGDRNGLDRMAASTSRMGRFETEWLTTDSKLAALSDLSGVWIDRVHDRRFSYRAKSRDKAGRIVAEVEWHPGELFLRVGLDPLRGSSVTNLNRPAERVVAFYNQRGTAEQHIKEGKNAINWTRLSCQSFRNSEVRLQLHALAYNLGKFLRTLALPEAVEHWSLTTLREKPIKMGAKVVRHGRYVTFQLAEVAVPRSLFQKIAGLIDDLRRRPAPALAEEIHGGVKNNGRDVSGWQEK